jgi:hypothetical protein
VLAEPRTSPKLRYFVRRSSISWAMGGHPRMISWAAFLPAWILSSRFVSWVLSLTGAAIEVIAIGGKAVRRSFQTLPCRHRGTHLGVDVAA